MVSWPERWVGELMPVYQRGAPLALEIVVPGDKEKRRELFDFLVTQIGRGFMLGGVLSRDGKLTLSFSPADGCVQIVMPRVPWWRRWGWQVRRWLLSLGKGGRGSHDTLRPRDPAEECPGQERGGTAPACCERAGQYNGYGSDGPPLFRCPKSCGCHD